VGIVALLGGMPEADAHDNDTDSVNSSEEIIADDNSIYGLSILFNPWDDLNCYWSSSCNGVDVDVRSRSSSTTLVVDDVSKCGANWAGMYSPSYSPDKIRLNICALRDYSSSGQKGVIGHELGHALGFDHPPCNATYQRTSIMPSGCKDPNPWPASHDKSDYYEMWIN
jgi:hypothetical protein